MHVEFKHPVWLHPNRSKPRPATAHTSTHYTVGSNSKNPPKIRFKNPWNCLITLVAVAICKLLNMNRMQFAEVLKPARVWVKKLVKWGLVIQITYIFRKSYTGWRESDCVASQTQFLSKKWINSAVFTVITWPFACLVLRQSKK